MSEPVIRINDTNAPEHGMLRMAILALDPHIKKMQGFMPEKDVFSVLVSALAAHAKASGVDPARFRERVVGLADAYDILAQDCRGSA